MFGEKCVVKTGFSITKFIFRIPNFLWGSVPLYQFLRYNSTMTSLQNDLFALQEKKYQQFQSKLLPTINSNKIIGIRVPILRNFAKSFSKTGAAEQFLGSVPHDFYEENLLHMILLSFEKDFDVWKNRITNS